jgi:glycosyltransferase involved in cell wall biosynthesis
MKNKKILLFDNFSEGHHETYILAYTKKLLQLENTILVFYPKTDIFLELKRQYGNKLKTSEVKLKICSSPFKNKYLNILSNTFLTLLLWIKTKSLIKKGLKQMNEKKPDLIFFLWIDSFLNPFLKSWMIDLFFRFQWAGLYFHPTYLRTSTSSFLKINKPSGILRSKFCKFIAILDEGVSKNLSIHTNKIVYILPDVTDETLELDDQIYSEILNKANGRKIIGLLGFISKRKGLLSLIDTINKADQGKYFFIIAGEVSLRDYTPEEAKKVNTFFEKKHNNCYFDLKQISDGKKFNTLINSCDMLLAVYEDFYHSSNILTKASLFNKFVIVNDKYLTSERVSRYQLGVCIEQKNSEELLQAIESLTKGNDLDENKLEPEFKKYYYEHSQEKLIQTLSEINI